jgi:serine/threonine protein kinase/formylglycine-generating enzyme required for sulfatase activity
MLLSMASEQRDPPPPRAGERLLAAWLQRIEAGDDRDLESLCRERPELAAEIDALVAQFDELRGAAPEGSLSQRLRQRFGGDVDPKVELPDEAAGSGDPPSDVMSRLAERGPASTRYRLRGEVAQGGMGAVLRVWDEDLRRHLAMKVMLEGVPDPDRRRLARFLEEAQVTGQLDHPGIVPVHELGLDSTGRVYFTMKLVRGRTLKQVFDALARGEDGWTTTRVLGLLLKVCEAVRYAHDKGVIHRDLKPANVMVGRYGEVYVMDWGLARVLERADGRDLRVRDEPATQASRVRTERAGRAGETPDSPLYTMDGDVLGTPAYMPPEQAHGRLEAMGPHSDVYALGAMLYHLLAGHMPYVRDGESASNYAVWRWVREGPPAPLLQECPHAPAELAAICERAMQREPAARYPDMAALADDLSAFLEGRVVEAFESGALAEARKWVRRNPALSGALGAALLAIVAGAAAFAIKAREATRAAALADASAHEAREQRDLAVAERAKVLRLSDAKVLGQLRVEAETLWPPYPERIGALESWLTRTRAILAGLDQHRQNLEHMRAAAHEVQAQELTAALAAHPLSRGVHERREERTNLAGQLGRPLTELQREWTQARIERLDLELTLLAEQLDGSCRWSFEATEDQWQHDLLVELVADLAWLRAGLLAEDSVAPPQGWSVPRRLEFARRLAQDFAPGGWCARAWEDALPRLRADHPELDLAPQMGLVPIGRDPDSGRWEFAHLLTGEVPARDAQGRLEFDERSGVVLVLFDRDGFWRGAQAQDPGGQNFDPQAVSNEQPVREVELSPFLLSKYELTQAQWLRLTGWNPSLYKENWNAPDGSRISWLHPVEQVSWTDVTTWLPRADLQLPSEAQWEYAARGGTETPWWTGSERESLRGERAANLADRSAALAGAAWSGIGDWPELEDGYIVHAPVTDFAPNPAGLFGVVGNVWELCQDGYDERYYARSPRLDPLCDGAGRVARVARGGGYDYSAAQARSSARGYYPPATFNGGIGARPARSVDD